MQLTFPWYLCSPHTIGTFLLAVSLLLKALNTSFTICEVYALRVQFGGGMGPIREGYKVVALLLKASLGLFGLVGRHRVLLQHPGSATGHLILPWDHHTLQHIQVHFGVDFQADFEDVRWHDEALTWNHTKDHNRSQKLCFHHPGHIPVIRGNPDLHFEGAGNGTVAITWIGREPELYSGASLISLVEHGVTFRHDRRLLPLLGFVHNWPTSRWSATKKENRFSLCKNGIMSSFLGRQNYRSTLYSYILIQWVQYTKNPVKKLSIHEHFSTRFYV